MKYWLTLIAPRLIGFVSVDRTTFNRNRTENCTQNGQNIRKKPSIFLRKDRKTNLLAMPCRSPRHDYLVRCVLNSCQHINGIMLFISMENLQNFNNWVFASAYARIYTIRIVHAAVRSLNGSAYMQSADPFWWQRSIMDTIQETRTKRTLTPTWSTNKFAWWKNHMQSYITLLQTYELHIHI